MNTSIRNICLLAMLLLYSSTASTQNQWIDSVRNVATTQKPDTSKVLTLIALSETLLQNDPDSGLFYAQQALSLAENLEFDKGIFWSIVSINKSLFILGNYTLELDYAFRAYPLGKKLNNTYTIGWANGMIGDCYCNLEEYDSCIKYYRQALKLAKQNSIIDLFSLYSAFVPVFINLHQYDSALLYAKKGYTLFKSNPLLNKGDYNTKWSKSYEYRFLGDAFAGLADYDSSLFYYHLSLPFWEGVRMETFKIDVYNGIAKVYKEKNNLDSAVRYARRVLTEKITKNYPVGLLKAANTLADIYDVQHKPDSTLKYMRIALSIKESLFNREKTVAIQNIFFKEKEKHKEVAAAKSKLQSEYRMYFLIALFIILLTASGIIIKNRRQKQLQNIRNHIADDLHDDIGSTLSSISIMSELAKANPSNSSLLLGSIGESTVTIQENMSDIVWTIKSGNDRFENVVHRMNQFASEILEAKKMELDFKSDATLSSSKLSMEQRKNVYLFFKEAVNNAVKYSDASKVSVRLTQKGRYAEMKISDNGRGFDTTESFSGNGMSSLGKRATELKGDYKITSRPNDGTMVELRFKIT